MYAYGIRNLLADERYEVTLAPGVTVTDRVVELSDGRLHTSTRVEAPERQLRRRLTPLGEEPYAPDTRYHGCTHWQIVDAAGDVIETIAEPSYGNGRATDRRIVDIEFERFLDRLEEVAAG